MGKKEKEEKEIILDLSKKIKLGDNYYISIGSFLISFSIMIIQMFSLGFNWSILLNFIYSLRKKNQKIKPHIDD